MSCVWYNHNLVSCCFEDLPNKVALPCLGPLAPRGAVGARHDGLLHQPSPLLPVVCHGLFRRSNPWCCQPTSSSAYPFSACSCTFFRFSTTSKNLVDFMIECTELNWNEMWRNHIAPPNAFNKNNLLFDIVDTCLMTTTCLNGSQLTSLATVRDNCPWRRYVTTLLATRDVIANNSSHLCYLSRIFHIFHFFRLMLTSRIIWVLLLINSFWFHISYFWQLMLTSFPLSSYTRNLAHNTINTHPQSHLHRKRSCTHPVGLWGQKIEGFITSAYVPWKYSFVKNIIIIHSLINHQSNVDYCRTFVNFRNGE